MGDSPCARGVAMCVVTSVVGSEIGRAKLESDDEGRRGQ